MDRPFIIILYGNNSVYTVSLRSGVTKYGALRTNDSSNIHNFSPREKEKTPPPSSIPTNSINKLSVNSRFNGGSVKTRHYQEQSINLTRFIRRKMWEKEASRSTCTHVLMKPAHNTAGWWTFTPSPIQTTRSTASSRGYTFSFSVDCTRRCANSFIYIYRLYFRP